MVFFVAWSISSGVISTVVLTWTAPLAVTARETAAALALSVLFGRLRYSSSAWGHYVPGLTIGM